jgi:hypothetical protein
MTVVAAICDSGVRMNRRGRLHQIAWRQPAAPTQAAVAGAPGGSDIDAEVKRSERKVNLWDESLFARSR